jgi:hypothetical protein
MRRKIQRPPKIARKKGKRNETCITTTITIASIGAITPSRAMYLATTPTSGRSAGTYEQVKGSFCQL